jgi:hypothetical protein
MPPQPLQYARLTESNLKEHTKSFVDRTALQEQFILDYVLEQQVINNERSQKSEKGTFCFVLYTSLLYFNSFYSI